MTPNIHDRARLLANAKGIPVSLAYSELARRSGSARSARRRRVFGTMQITAASFSATSGIETPRYRLPYADN